MNIARNSVGRRCCTSAITAFPQINMHSIGASSSEKRRFSSNFRLEFTTVGRSQFHNNGQTRKTERFSTTAVDSMEGKYDSSLSTAELVSEVMWKAIADTFGASSVILSDAVVFTGKADKGDYQSNAALTMSKRLGLKPFEIAERLSASIRTAAATQTYPVISDVTISGPGFLNLQLSLPFLQTKLQGKLQEAGRVGVPQVRTAQRVVVDYSSPNIAKEMHVGHLRSTIIGDSLSRVLQFLGHDVLRLNHVGDWGTQFGMLIAHLKDQQDAAQRELQISDLVVFYKQAKQRFDSDAVFQDTAREEVVKLQAGDAESLKAWRAICEKSRIEFQQVYDMLGVTGLEERGESFYNPFLPSLVQKLRTEGVARESDGAVVVFLNQTDSDRAKFKSSDGGPLPLMVQKSDGGFLYGTTDMAALTHRIQSERADRIIYVTDAGQAQHFEMVFRAAQLAGIIPPPEDSTGVTLTHVPFGLVLGEDGKKIKSRAGDSVKLRELLNEAVKIAGDEMSARAANSSNTESSQLYDEVELQRRARVVGIAAVKYADLSMNRESNYRFSFKKMLSLAGNTAPYMLYAYARIEGIRRKAAESTQSMQQGDIHFALAMPEELALAKLLIKFEDVLREVEKDLYPSKICDYLFDLSQRFNQFYERCPVLRAQDAQTLRDRAALCTLTSETLKLGLGLLGIETLDRL